MRHFYETFRWATLMRHMDATNWWIILMAFLASAKWFYAPVVRAGLWLCWFNQYFTSQLISFVSNTRLNGRVAVIFKILYKQSRIKTNVYFGKLQTIMKVADYQDIGVLSNTEWLQKRKEKLRIWTFFSLLYNVFQVFWANFL